MSAAITKTVRVCLQGHPKPADQCTPVDLDLGVITGWGDPLITALAAALEIDPATVTSVWLREGDDDDEPDRIDKKKRAAEARWQRLLSAEPHHVLLLGVATAAATQRVLNELIAHMQVRVGELTHALEANASVQVTIAGKDGKPSLGKGAAVEQWRGQLGARLGADAHARFVEALDSALLLLAADFPQRVRFDVVSGAAASIEHFQVWGANARNWQRPDGAKISGSGQAAAMGVQRPGVFGIITTPKYPLNAGSPDPKRCAVL